MKTSLRFADIDTLQITRRSGKSGWLYYDGAGKRISDKAQVTRLNAIALPPAYTEARFSGDPDAHIQAYGMDARGRRQYRYHGDFRASKEAEKFGLCVQFGRALPNLRRRVEEHLSGDPMAYETVLAAVVRILDSAHLRVGNEQYVRANKSFGVTTLRNRHASVKGQSLQLQYRGKGGLERSVKLGDRALTRVVRRCQDLPGQALFQYRDADGNVRRIDSQDVNAYIREASGGDFTAKHFRTWAASVIGFGKWLEGAPLGDLLAEVSDALGNTPAVARKSYIHPDIIEAAKDGPPVTFDLPRSSKWMRREERGLIGFLQKKGRKRKPASK